ncbi:hypothetical protein [Nonomuraea recticatena]|uniref:hypothetical protein n=1 Tax=Nonomuraea recticatena TaxID=46178 RepID=UPI00361AB2AA
MLHLLPQVGDPRPGAAALQRAPQPALLVGALAADGGCLSSRCSRANAAAAAPARAPKTRISGSELEPRRLAPLMLTHAVSPAANSPAIGVAPWRSVWTPPIM